MTLETGNGFAWGLLIATIVSIATVIFFDRYNPNPRAIDVYRGKTTLEITYRDSVAVDSVVVYKVR